MQQVLSPLPLDTAKHSHAQSPPMTEDDVTDTAWTEVRESILFEAIDALLPPETTAVFQVTALAKIEEAKWVIRLGRKITLGLERGRESNLLLADLICERSSASWVFAERVVPMM
ncbi:MAG: hypothetical protein QOH96_4241 [Blastocatellia bacterium]|nr:hypothetical protein [Blastocatellia bacterium]